MSAVLAWSMAIALPVIALSLVVLLVQQRVRRQKRRAAAASVRASVPPANDSLPAVGLLDLDELWLEIRFAMTLHRIGQDVTEGAPEEWVP